MASEKSPLLSNEQYPHGVSEYGEQRNVGSGQNVCVSVPAIGPNELPPPYSSLQSGGLMINCGVCNSMVDILGKRDQPVVKCSNCNEATPIKTAPPGRRYVRCPCNCLLICKSNSERIACPRTHCKRVIRLVSNPVTPTVPSVPGMCQVSCAHCHDMFLFNTLNNSLARCPHCRKVSSIDHFARRRGIRFLAVGLLLLIISSIIIGVTCYLVATYGGMYIVFIGLPVVGILLLLRGVYFITMKISVIEGPA